MKKVSLVLCLVIGAVGCAPSLDDPIRVTTVPMLAQSGGDIRPDGEGIEVLIEPFQDERGPESGIQVEDRVIPLEGKLAAVVRAAVDRELRAVGAITNVRTGMVLTGSVVRWGVQMRREFPVNKFYATAGLSLRVFSPQGAVLYRATYTGDMETTEAVSGRKSIQKLIEGAMSQALNEAMHDQALFNALRSGVRSSRSLVRPSASRGAREFNIPRDEGDGSFPALE